MPRAIGETTLMSGIEPTTSAHELTDRRLPLDPMTWLPHSYWRVEGQLLEVQRQRHQNTLNWALEMQEFRNWRESGLNSQERALWIRGTPGLGKSVMAGRLIKYLQDSFPNSIVAYFFCKGGEPELTDVQHILCTLAYQCAKNCKEAQTVLEVFKDEFPKVAEVGIRSLFRRVLEEPLKHVTRDVYLILDGLDEADTAKMDRLEKRPEFKVLIECLGMLKSTRVLFISRPEVSLDKLIRPLAIKSLSDKDNIVDIETYINQKFSDSETLRKWYPKNSSDAVKDFVNKSKGLFLWVFIVLEQLSSETDYSKFQEYLNSISEASGDMDELYSKILSRIVQREKRWVSEVLRWVTIAQRGLELDELKAAVQWSLNDKKIDFEMFLRVQCGSIVRIIPGSEDNPTVQLLHETFRSYILDCKKCPPGLWIDEERIHGYVAVKCLQYMTIEDDSNIFNKYAAQHWVDHLSKGTSREQCFEILTSLYQFFNSNAVRVWIRTALLKVPRWEIGRLSVRVEEKFLEDIKTWISKLQLWFDNTTEMETLKSMKNDVELAMLRKWSEAVLHEKQRLGIYVGKAAVNVWLYDNNDNFQEIQTAFALGWKYYHLRENNSLRRFDKIGVLTATKLRDMALWAGNEHRRSTQLSNEGVAFSTLQQWDDCIRCFKVQLDTQPDSI